MPSGPLLAVLGDPVTQSLSPRFQGAALRESGLGGDYRAIRVARPDLAARLGMLADEGFSGLNLTVPLKEEGFRILASEKKSGELLSDTARRLRAVNTLRWDGESRAWSGTNTDCEGFRLAAEKLAADRPNGLAGLDVLLIGAGGAARAVLLALCEAGVRRVRISNRGQERLTALLADLAPWFGDSIVAACPRGSDLPRADLYIQASPLGLSSDDPLPPLPPQAESAEAPLAMDLITHDTAWQSGCRERGCTCMDGREMLLRQGMAGFTYWTGLPAPEAAMREAVFAG